MAMAAGCERARSARRRCGWCHRSKSSRSWMVEPVARPVEPAGRLDRAEHRLGLVEHRDLHQHIAGHPATAAAAPRRPGAHGRKRVPTRASRTWLAASSASRLAPITAAASKKTGRSVTSPAAPAGAIGAEDEPAIAPCDAAGAQGGDPHGRHHRLADQRWRAASRPSGPALRAPRSLPRRGSRSRWWRRRPRPGRHRARARRSRPTGTPWRRRARARHGRRGAPPCGGRWPSVDGASTHPPCRGGRPLARPARTHSASPGRCARIAFARA